MKKQRRRYKIKHFKLFDEIVFNEKILGRSGGCKCIIIEIGDAHDEFSILIADQRYGDFVGDIMLCNISDLNYIKSYKNKPELISSLTEI